MTKQLLGLLVLFVVLGYQIYQGAVTANFQVVDVQSTEGLAEAVTGAWFPLAHGSHNAFLMWRWDNILGYVAKLLNGVYHAKASDLPQVYDFICLLFGGLGVFCFSLMSSNKTGSILCALTWMMALFGLWGADSVVLGSFAWLPWLCLALTAAFSKGKVWYYLAALFFVWRLSLAANFIALYLIPLSIFLSMYLAKSAFDWKRSVFCFVLFIPLTISLCRAPDITLPDYPIPDVHLVADDGLPGMIRPSVGPDALATPVIDRQFVKSAYKKPLVALLIAIVVLGIVSAWKTKKQLFGITLLLLICALLDAWPTDDISNIMPLATFSRIVPFSIFMPLLPIAVASAIFIFIVQLRVSNSELCALFIALLCAPTGTPVFQSENATAARTELNDLLTKDPSAISKEKYLVSPSLHILNTYGLWVLDLPSKVRLRSIASLDRGYKLYDSKGTDAEALKVLVDGKWKTRWNIPQKGSEWLMLRFSSPKTLSVIAPLLGKHFKTDFPRGVRLSVAESCDEENPQSADFKKVVEMRDWQGKIKLSDAGYPYFAAQSDMEISLKEPTTAQCWLLERIGSDGAFDWSIAELRAKSLTSL